MICASRHLYMLYLDHNATTPLSFAAKEAWLEASEQFPGNPSSPHRLGSRADRAMEERRESLASIIGGSPLDLVWTSGATEASNMVFHHYASVLEADEEVWVSAIEHPCVLAAAKGFLGDRVRLIPVTAGGVVEWDVFPSWLKEKRPALVVCMAANNETGVMQPWAAIRDWCANESIPFFCDAAQWLGKYDASGLGSCDWTMGCAHKFGGPKGVGFLKVPSKGGLNPLVVGGPQERSRRAGTENLAGVISMLAALEERQSRFVESSWLKEQCAMRAAVEGEILEKLPGTIALGAGEERLWNTIAVVMPECDCRFRWVVKLDRLGVAVSTGSACSSGKEQPSHVLEAMGCSPDEASRVLRFSSGPETSRDDWASLVEALVRVRQEADAFSAKSA